MAYASCTSIALGASQTGLTLKAQLVDADGVNVGSEITTGFTEIANGYYLWYYDGFPDGHRGGVKFLTTGNVFKAFHSINPEEGENLDAKVGTRLAAADYTAPDNASIALIKAKTDNLPASPAATGDAMALTTAERAALMAFLFDDDDSVETGLTLRGALRLISASLAGLIAGAGTTEVTIRSAVSDAKVRITATVDESGNRLSISYDLS
jgi:hypothetical protein